MRVAVLLVCDFVAWVLQVELAALLHDIGRICPVAFPVSHCRV